MNYINKFKSFGRYYCMFPFEFAEENILKYTQKEDIVFDPFSGRGATVLCASYLNRIGISSEINKTGYVFSKSKIKTINPTKIITRINELEANFKVKNNIFNKYHDFFSYCYSKKIMSFLVYMKNNLYWDQSETDLMLAAFIIHHMQGDRLRSLSNQLPQTKSCGMQYSIDWWKKNNLTPPNIDPFSFLRKEILKRYSYGHHYDRKSKVLFGDSAELIANNSFKFKPNSIKMILTSPPYLKITDYHRDQWLRNWFLGDNPYQEYGDNYNTNELYYSLLENVFGGINQYLRDDFVFVIRTDQRKQSKDPLLNILYKYYSHKNIFIKNADAPQKTQTHYLHKDNQIKPGEIDIFLF